LSAGDPVDPPVHSAGRPEVRRCAAKGAHAIAFSENPAALGLPSVHTATWDPLWAACQETDTVVNMHIGSSSTFSRTSEDAPPQVIIALTFEGASHALVGWMPFLLDRLDEAWDHDCGQGGPVRAGHLAAAARQRDRVLPARPVRHHGVTRRALLGVG
jgi:hypothetical protein